MILSFKDLNIRNKMNTNKCNITVKSKNRLNTSDQIKTKQELAINVTLQLDLIIGLGI
jgi:hypothetical protein